MVILPLQIQVGIGESGCYNWLRERNIEVEWYKSIWINLAAPKHSLMAWLIINHALRLKDKLYCYNVSADDLCCISALSTETHMHLFQECPYVQQVMKHVHRLGTHLQDNDILKQIIRRRWSTGRKHVITSAVLAVWYMIWMQRNNARLAQQVTSPSVLAGQIICTLKNRLIACNTKSFSSRDGQWLSKVQMM
ncbi:uncharacterized protein LOC141620020 [Silene latifolia]|uniref:uncharacterized protein LOC141620020 n=1 Tax=Silene latifolia TaxID=37657 RepID=UPI003D78A68C